MSLGAAGMSDRTSDVGGLLGHKHWSAVTGWLTKSLSKPAARNMGGVNSLPLGVTQHHFETQTGSACNLNTAMIRI